MTKEEMMKQMQNLLGLQKQVRAKAETAEVNAKAATNETIDVAEISDSIDELAEMFCDNAVILSRISNALQGKKNPWRMEQPEDDDWDEDDIAYMDAIVLFAVPGMPPALIPEEDAVSKYPGFDDEQTFNCFELREGLVLHYMDHTWESDDDITICDPVFIATLDEDEEETVDLTAVDFLYAMEFLAAHTVTITEESGKTYQGYWLPKKAK